MQRISRKLGRVCLYLPLIVSMRVSQWWYKLRHPESDEPDDPTEWG